MTEQEQAEFERLRRRLENAEQAIYELCRIVSDETDSNEVGRLVEKFTTANFNNGAPFRGYFKA